MPYAASGSLTTDERTTSSSTEWSTQSEWEAYQSRRGVTITDGTVHLVEIPDGGVYNFDTFDSDIWTLHSSASYDSNNERVELVPNSSDSDGALEYDHKEIDSGVVVEYDQIIQDNSDAGFYRSNFFADGYNTVTTGGSSQTISNGIQFRSGASNNEISIRKVDGGSNSTLASTAFNIGTGTYNITIEIDPSADQAEMTIDDGSSSETVTASDSIISDLVSGSSTDTFSWEGGHFFDSGRKSVDNITIETL